MSQNKSPDGSYPDFPFVLPVDGEGVTEDKLCVSPTTGLGWIGKLIDAVGFLRARTPQAFVLASDGAGNGSCIRRTPENDGTTAFFSAVTVTSTYVDLTIATPSASALSWLVVPSLVVGAGGDELAYIVSTTTSNIRLAVRAINSGAAIDLTANVRAINLLVLNLDGYT
jgi:hypothetical protein